MFTTFDRGTLILKNGGSEVILLKPKHQFVYPNKENTLMVPNHEKKGDYYVNQGLPHLIDEL